MLLSGKSLSLLKVSATKGQTGQFIWVPRNFSHSFTEYQHSKWRVKKQRLPNSLPDPGVWGGGQGTSFLQHSALERDIPNWRRCSRCSSDTFIQAGSSELEVISRNYSWRHWSLWPDSGKCACYKVGPRRVSGLYNSLTSDSPSSYWFFFWCRE